MTLAETDDKEPDPLEMKPVAPEEGKDQIEKDLDNASKHIDALPDEDIVDDGSFHGLTDKEWSARAES
jgi:hypothetical protein